MTTLTAPSGADTRPHATRNLAPLHVQGEGIADEAQAAINAGQLVTTDIEATGPDQTLFLDLSKRAPKITLPSDPVEQCRVTIYPALGDKAWSVEAEHGINAPHELVGRVATFVFEDGVWSAN
jgi:hypothetical protein